MSESIEDQYHNLKKEVETARAECDRARGALDQLMGRLREEFNCQNLAEAKVKLQELKSEKEKLEKDLARGLSKYKKKWGEK